MYNFHKDVMHKIVFKSIIIPVEVFLIIFCVPKINGNEPLEDQTLPDSMGRMLIAYFHIPAEVILIMFLSQRSMEIQP